ncbi:MAG: porin [Bacteroidales bacterium]|jgi:phosphate-selective porin OprO/OprP|nr:porin [Bacteroidales bacterium]MDD3811105.1 porin [Bacteroidales bacterium]MDD4811697.1 porin [Bacteroidales bacterium]
MKSTKLVKTGLAALILLSFGTVLWGQVNDTVRYNRYGVKVNRNALVAEERNGILTLESKNQDYRIWYDARVQVDGASFFGDTYNEIGDGLSIRRARFAVKTEFANRWYAEIDMDISNSQLELKDAYLQYTIFDGLEVKAGNFKEGYSMESTTTSRYLTFIERPMAVNAFAPSRHIGAAATFSKFGVFAMGGIHFQKVDDIEERTYSLDNNKDFGMDEGISLTGKVVVMPWHNDPDKGLHLGVAGSYREPKTDSEIAGALRYSTRSLTSINRKKYIDTDLMGDIDYATLGGLEFAAYYKGLRLQGEYLMSDVHRLNELPTESFNGFYVFASALLFGGKQTYNKNEAEFTQPRRGKSWGDVELSFRYDYLSLNSRMDGIMGGAGEGYTVGLNYHINNNVKIMLNYAYLNHDRYASGKNKLFVGYDEAGNLTRNPKLVVDPQGKAGENFHMLAIRCEVDF